MKPRRGLTLIEVLVALGLAGMVITMAIQAWKISLQMTDSAAKVRNSSQILSAILQTVRRELSVAARIESPPKITSDRLYDAERSNDDLSASTAEPETQNTHSIELWGNRNGFCFVESSGDLNGIVLAGQPPPNISWNGSPLELRDINSNGLLKFAGHADSVDAMSTNSFSREVSRFDCKYFDGKQWTEQWEPFDSRPLPVAVRVRVQLASGDVAEDVIALQPEADHE